MNAHPEPDRIHLMNEQGYPLSPAQCERLIAAARAVLAQDAQPDGALTIVITDDDEVRRLNVAYRGIDAPTDILSFAADLPDDLPEGVGIDDEEGEEDDSDYLGDLVIAYPYASAQAVAQGHDLTDSLCLLVAHGTLHLLGYDHDTPDRRAQMWSAQARALQALGVPLGIVPALEQADDTPDEPTPTGDGWKDETP